MMSLPQTWVTTNALPCHTTGTARAIVIQMKTSDPSIRPDQVTRRVNNPRSQITTASAAIKIMIVRIRKRRVGNG